MTSSYIDFDDVTSAQPQPAASPDTRPAKKPRLHKRQFLPGGKHGPAKSAEVLAFEQATAQAQREAKKAKKNRRRRHRKAQKANGDDTTSVILASDTDEDIEGADRGSNADEASQAEETREPMVE